MGHLLFSGLGGDPCKFFFNPCQTFFPSPRSPPLHIIMLLQPFHVRSPLIENRESEILSGS